MGTSTNSSKPWASDLSLNRPPNPGPRDFPPILPTLALYQHEVQAVVDSVPQMLAEGDPLDALRLWFLRLAEYVRLKHGLGEALHSAAAENVVNDTYAPVTAAVGQLLVAAEQAGQVRAGLDPRTCSVSWGSRGVSDPANPAPIKPDASSI
jgi:hypothetical protein